MTSHYGISYRSGIWLYKICIRLGRVCIGYGLIRVGGINLGFIYDEYVYRVNRGLNKTVSWVRYMLLGLDRRVRSVDMVRLKDSYDRGLRYEELDKDLRYKFSISGYKILGDVMIPIILLIASIILTIIISVIWKKYKPKEKETVENTKEEEK